MDEDTEIMKSDADYIQEKFESHDFSVVMIILDALEYASPANRKRWWCVVFDIPPNVSREYGLERKFYELLNCLKIPPRPVEDCLLDHDALETACAQLPYGLTLPPPKRKCEDVSWKLVHESICLKFKLQWPRFTECEIYNGLRQREAELASIADELFPSKAPVGTWEVKTCQPKSTQVKLS